MGQCAQLFPYSGLYLLRISLVFTFWRPHLERQKSWVTIHCYTLELFQFSSSQSLRRPRYMSSQSPSPCTQVDPRDSKPALIKSQPSSVPPSVCTWGRASPLLSAFLGASPTDESLFVMLDAILSHLLT